MTRWVILLLAGVVLILPASCEANGIQVLIAGNMLLTSSAMILSGMVLWTPMVRSRLQGGQGDQDAKLILWDTFFRGIPSPSPRYEGCLTPSLG